MHTLVRWWILPGTPFSPPWGLVAGGSNFFHVLLITFVEVSFTWSDREVRQSLRSHCPVSSFLFGRMLLRIYSLDSTQKSYRPSIHSRSLTYRTSLRTAFYLCLHSQKYSFTGAGGRAQLRISRDELKSTGRGSWPNLYEYGNPRGSQPSLHDHGHQFSLLILCFFLSLGRIVK